MESPKFWIEIPKFWIEISRFSMKIPKFWISELWLLPISNIFQNCDDSAIYDSILTEMYDMEAAEEDPTYLKSKGNRNFSVQYNEKYASHKASTDLEHR